MRPGEIVKERFLQIHPDDEVLVALENLVSGERIAWKGNCIALPEDIPAKHKLASRDFKTGEAIHMYGVVVGVATREIARGGLLSTRNVRHAATDFGLVRQRKAWTPPGVSRFADLTFDGFQRRGGRVGTANHWIVVPLVFCENRNLLAIKEAMVKELGYDKTESYRLHVRRLMDRHKAGASRDHLLSLQLDPASNAQQPDRLFPNVDGIKFLLHEGGCGCTRQDSDELCGLLAGYIVHPNVAGATVLSLGCQNAQVNILRREIARRDAHFDKPLLIFEQQWFPSEKEMMRQAINQTFAGLIEADKCRRKPAPASKLVIGVKCGGSDGFSGISANPAIGHCSDLVVALGGAVILSEFPELCGVEQDLIDRCVDDRLAAGFIHLQKAYENRAKAVGSSLDMNPSPGNIRDGLITDAMKSAGAARKAGTSPVTDVLDYPDWVTQCGLNLLCTPGGDVESTTAMAGAGANLILFSTGLGTPTGNAVAPVIKISSNTDLYRRMPDLIDVDAGGIVTGDETIPAVGERLLEACIAVASGRMTTKAMDLGQDDFIPWKRGMSL
ncbi:MAG: UxaA family hydrolase [bacterium]